MHLLHCTVEMGRNLSARIFLQESALFSTHGKRPEDRSPPWQAAADRGKNRAAPKKLTIFTTILWQMRDPAAPGLEATKIDMLVCHLSEALV
jgi:hypothetical protein